MLDLLALRFRIDSMTSPENNVWKKCSSCKNPILFRQKYFICSVSTCSGQRTGYVFCSIPCFETHLPGAKHRDAGAIEKTAPSMLVTQPTANSSSATTGQSQTNQEVLIVASKLKDYIKIKSDMNTSAAVMDILSDMVRGACDRAIDSARADGRKTVLDRDFKIKL